MIVAVWIALIIVCCILMAVVLVRCLGTPGLKRGLEAALLK